MKPAPFEYYAPDTLDEAVALMAEYGYDAKVLAGGQSLIPTMNFRLAQPAVLIDLNRIADLAYIKPLRDGGVRIGAMTRQSQVERDDLVAAAAPLVHETMPTIAHPQIRNRGTFGGSIAHADPASELPAVLVTLGGQVEARNQRGSRRINAEDCFLGIFTTALEVDEILTEVRLPPMAARTGWAVLEVARRHGDFALVGVTVLLTLNPDGGAAQVRLTLFGVGDGPVAALQCSAVLSGQQPTAENIAAAAELAASADIDPANDMHATAAFRRHLARVLARRALSIAAARAEGKGGVD